MAAASAKNDDPLKGNKIRYVLQSEKTEVEGKVLFGDQKDVEISNASKRPTKSYGGTIIYTLRPWTKAVPGTYVYAKCYIGTEWFHLIHHQSLDGEAIARFLYRSTGAENFRLDNVWNRYDWCHFRNWGGEEECDNMIHFVPVIYKPDKDTQTRGPRPGKSIKLTSDCILGDWFYGLRLVDPDTGLAYAYEFGDTLVHRDFDCSWHGSTEYHTDFNVKMDRFLPRPLA